jgi:hypothetical protein
MHLRNKLAAILMGSMLAAAAGCADEAHVTGPRTASDAPAYDGSGWAGSGNRTESDSTTAADSISTGGRGSGWAGSGN